MYQNNSDTLKIRIEINAIHAWGQEKADEVINAVGMLKNATTVYVLIAYLEKYSSMLLVWFWCDCVNSLIIFL